MILPYTILQTKKLNVIVKPSKNKNKKIDVFKDNKKIASVGAKAYSDYPTYIKTHGKDYADKRRELYKKRHEKDIHKINSNGYYANKLLW